MYKIWIRFKESSGWRPQCRHADDLDAAMAIAQDAFDRWPVRHVSLFVGDNYLRTFFFPPNQTSAARQLAREKQKANGIFCYF